MVVRLLKRLVRKVCTVRIPGIYLEFFVYAAARELGLVTEVVFTDHGCFESFGSMLPVTINPYILYKKSAGLLQKFDPFTQHCDTCGVARISFSQEEPPQCDTISVFGLEARCGSAGWQRFPMCELIEKAQHECRAFFGRPEAVTIFDVGPYPYMTLPRACESMILSAAFRLDEHSVPHASLDELGAARADAAAVMEKARRLQELIENEVFARLLNRSVS